MKLERIVIGMDFGAASVAAARWTARHLAPSAELTLVHCLPAAEPSSPKRCRAAAAAAAARLVALARTLALDRTRVQVRTGDPAECIAQLAAELDADLVVVGPHNRRPEAADDLGSTAERLVQRSPAPVLLATGELSGPTRRLLVPVERSDITAPVLEWARALAARCTARLAVVHVEDARRPEAAMPAAGETNPRWRLLTADRQPDGVFIDAVSGEPADVILAEADRFASDLVVLGAGTADGVAAPAAVEETSRILRGARCPVLVVADRAGRAPADVLTQTQPARVAAEVTC